MRKVLAYLLGAAGVLFLVATFGAAVGGEFAGALVCLILGLVCFGCAANMNGSGNAKAGSGGSQAASLSPQEKAVAGNAAALVLDGTPETALRALSQLPEVRNAPDPLAKRRELVLKTLPVVVRRALEDCVISKEEEEGVLKLMELTGISPADVDPQTMDFLRKGAVIRDLVEGNVNPVLDRAQVPFMLSRREVPIWCWHNVEMLERGTVSEWRSGNSGFSIRVMKGVYWRVGAGRGHRVSREVNRSLGRGTLAVTSRHVWFAGTGTARRIRLDKIIHVEPCSDGVLLHLDGARAKPVAILCDDVWFLANVLVNAQNWA